MPQPRAAVCRVHDDTDCQCYKAPAVAAQSLEELDYLKGACAAAQQGNCIRLQSILDRHPEAIASDGTQGSCGW